jgi:CBS domain-containing protein
MSIKQFVINRPVFTVQRTDTVQEAVEYMAARNIGAVSVMEGPLLAGIFSERDLINRVVAKGLDPRRTPVGSVMTRDLVVADANDSYEVCLKKMTQANCRHLPIVDGDRLLGIISLRDLLQVEITEKDAKIEFLHEYMFHLPPGAERQEPR